MSTNNQLVIIKKGKWFEVHENMCVDDNFECTKKNLLQKEDTLNRAIIFAQNYCREYPYVEYGYIIADNCLEEKE